MRARAALILVLLVLANLTGCAPGSGPAPVNPDVTSTEPAPGPATAPASDGTPGAPVQLTYWEEDADEAGVVLDRLADGFTAANPGITIERVHYSFEDLRLQFREISRGNLEGTLPDLVRGPGEYAGPFSELGIVQPAGDLFSADALSEFFSGAIDGSTVRGRVWGLPDNFDDHLMLFYNRALVTAVPGDTDAWVAQLKTLTDAPAGRYGLVFAINESYWLIPWLSGFGGWPLDAGDRPALDTAEMVEALWFVHDLRFAHLVVPEVMDYDEAFKLFGEGNAAYVIDGRWNLERYQGLGIDVGIAMLPRVSKTGIFPAPMATGQYWFVRQGLAGGRLDPALRFVEYMTSAEAQETWVTELKRLPSNREAANSAVVTGDSLLAPMVGQLRVARGAPPALEMACAWRGMDAQLGGVMRGQVSPDKAVTAMQRVADTCVTDMTPDPTPTATP